MGICSHNCLHIHTIIDYPLIRTIFHRQKRQLITGLCCISFVPYCVLYEYVLRGRVRRRWQRRDDIDGEEEAEEPASGHAHLPVASRGQLQHFARVPPSAQGATYRTCNKQASLDLWTHINSFVVTGSRWSGGSGASGTG